MNRGEQSRESEHEGDRYLRLLGLDHLADRVINTSRGPRQARDFLDICGDEALPPLRGLERVGRDDPRFEPMREMLRAIVASYIEGTPTES